MATSKALATALFCVILGAVVAPGRAEEAATDNLEEEPGRRLLAHADRSDATVADAGQLGGDLAFDAHADRKLLSEEGREKFQANGLAVTDSDITPGRKPLQLSNTQGNNSKNAQAQGKNAKARNCGKGRKLLQLSNKQGNNSKNAQAQGKNAKASNGCRG